MAPSPPPESVIEAIQVLVNTGNPMNSRQVIESRSDDLLTDAADGVLLAGSYDRASKGKEGATCTFESWRALLARCRNDGIDVAFERQSQFAYLDNILATLGLSDGQPLRIIGEEDPFRISPADNAFRSSMMAALIRPALQFVDAATQPFTQAILQAEMAFALCGVSGEDEPGHLDEAIALAEAAIPALRSAPFQDRLARAQFGLGIASLERHARLSAEADLTAGIDACHEAGWRLIHGYDEKRDETDLNRALYLFRRALDAAPRGVYDWPRRRYDVGTACYYRFKAKRYNTALIDTSRGTVQVDAGDLDEAITAWREAMEASSDDSPKRITYQSNLALALWTRFDQFGKPEDLDASIKEQRAVLALRSHNDGDSRGKLGMALWSRFLLNWDLADLDAAVSDIGYAVATCAPGADDWATWQSNLGVALRTRFQAIGDLADLEAAVEALEKSLEATQASASDWPRRRYNLGLALLSRFEFAGRTPDLDYAIAAFEDCRRVTSRRSHDWAMYTADLGVALRKRFEALGKRSDLDKTLELLRDALERAPEGSPESIRYQGNIGATLLTRYRSSGNPTDLDAAVDSIRGAVSANPERSAEWARNQSDLGAALTERFHLRKTDNDREAAIAAYELALATYQPNEWPDHVLSAGRALGNLHFSQRSWSAAAEAFQKAEQSFDLLYQRQLLGTGRENWLAAVGSLYQNLAYALARTGDNQGAVATLERGRARGLSDALARDRADLQRVRLADPEAHDLYQRAVLRLRQMAVAERAVETTPDQEAPRPPSDSAREQARQAHADLASVAARIRRIPGYEDFLSRPGFKDVTSAALPGIPLVYLASTLAGSLGLVVDQTSGSTDFSVEPLWLDDFSNDDLNALLIKRDGEKVVGGYLPGQLTNQTWLEESLAEVLPLLGKRIIGPIAACLRDLKAVGLTLIPSDRLGLMPLHAAGYRVDGRVQCLLEEFDVAYAPSARVLTIARATLAGKEGQAPILAGVGNPASSRPLQYARAELEEIEALFQDNSRRTLYEEDAVLDRLYRMLPGASYVHLACHGEFDVTEPLNSSLQLAGETPLTLRDLLDEDRFRSARLVALSACQTAITDFRRLPDEAIGLPAGCLQAGASGVISTLWSVNDLSTALLMVRFYAYHLRGNPVTGEGPMPPARAMRRAQLWLRGVTAGELFDEFEQRRVREAPSQLANAVVLAFALEAPESRPFAGHPYHWAPFIFIGS